MSSNYDVAIAGGGVAGASLATVLARAGLKVVVVEREARFRDRVRGEGLHPWGVAELVRLGLDDLLRAAAANPLPIWQRYLDRRPEPPFVWSEVSLNGLPEYAVHHPRLQEAALSAAVAAGAQVERPARAVALRLGATPELDLMTGRGSQTIRARMIVGADGKTSAVRSWAGIGVGRDPEHHQVGGVLLAGFDLPVNAAHEAPFPGGRVFTMPYGDGRARAYIVTNPGNNLETRRDRSGTLAVQLLASLYPAGAMTGASVAGPIAFFSNADQWSERVSREGLVLVGDAAGANDPSVGNGLSLVFRDVRELRDLLLDGDDWSAALREFEGRRRSYFEVVRHHAAWVAELVTEVGEEADARRARVEIAREQDPTAGGFSLLFARGPDGLVADAAARARFFGEVT